MARKPDQPSEDRRMLGPIGSPSSRTELIADELKMAILEGRLRPGEALVERDLAEMLGVSKTPIREALKILSQSGLVTSAAFRSTAVRTLTSTDVNAIYGVRRLLEPEAVRLATPQQTTARLEEADAELVVAAASAELEQYGRLSLSNRRFHRLLYECCGNDVMRTMLDDLQDKVSFISIQGWREHVTWPVEAEEHRAILEAVRARDGDLAYERSFLHIDGSLLRLRAAFSEQSELSRRGARAST